MRLSPAVYMHLIPFFLIAAQAYAGSYAATSTQMQAAHPSLFKPTIEQLRAYLETPLKKTAWTESRILHGIRFQHEDPAFLDSFARLTDTQVDLSFSKKNRPEKIFTSTCTRVICAAQEIFGRQQGLMLLTLDLFFGINASFLIHSEALPWTSDELNLIFNVLQDFPLHLQPIFSNRPLLHLKFEGGGAYANSSIFVYQSWDPLDYWTKRYAIFHELGHVAASALKQRFREAKSLDEVPQWLGFSKWTNAKAAGAPSEKKDASPWKAGLPDECVSDYSRTNPSEDFAESFAAYRYAPAQLKLTSPAKFNFMKELVFDGVDYMQPEPRKQRSNSQSLIQLAPPYFNEAAAIKWVASRCSSVIFSELEAAYSRKQTLLRLSETPRKCIVRNIQGFLVVQGAQYSTDQPKISLADLYPSAPLSQPSIKDAGLPSSWDAEWPKRIESKILEALRLGFTNFARSLEIPSRYQFFMPQTTSEDFCVFNSKFAYNEAARAFAPTFDETSLTSTDSTRRTALTFRNRVFFSALGKQICLDARRDAPFTGTPTAATEQQIANAVHAALQGQ